jgi:hypothetical protein
MALTGEWDIPFTLYCDARGDLNLNTATGYRYLLVQSACEMGPAVRSTKDNVPQGDGSILHRRFLTGVEARLTMQLWHDDDPACGTVLREMLDELSIYEWQLLNSPDNFGRLIWQPSGYGDLRMLDDIRLLEPMTVRVPESGLGVTVTFVVDTQWPYAMDITENQEPLNVTAINAGTTDFYPVFKIYGAPGTGSPAFTIYNMTTGLKIVYNAALPGGFNVPPTPQYVEIDTFRNTVYVNGDGAKAIQCIDMLQTDFFTLVPGDNDLVLSGAWAGDVLWNNAWI